MKKSILLLSAFLLILQVSAQQDTIQNGGFEEWNFNPQYDDPAHWTTLNPLASILGVRLAYKATAAGEFHSGTAAIKLVTSNIPSIGVAPGIVTNGVVNTASQTIEGGVPMTTRPSSLGGWYRFDPVNTDTGNVNLELTRWDAVNGTREVVGFAAGSFSNTNGTFVNFEFDFIYETANLPDTALLLFASGGDQSPQEGTALFIDDLYYTYPAGIETPEALGLSIFPNPTSNVLNFRSEMGHQFNRATVLSIDGKLMSNISLSSTTSQVDVSELPTGTYIIELQSKEGVVVRQSFLKN